MGPDVPTDIELTTCQGTLSESSSTLLVSCCFLQCATAAALATRTTIQITVIKARLATSVKRSASDASEGSSESCTTDCEHEDGSTLRLWYWEWEGGGMP